MEHSPYQRNPNQRRCENAFHGLVGNPCPKHILAWLAQAFENASGVFCLCYCAHSLNITLVKAQEN